MPAFPEDDCLAYSRLSKLVVSDMVKEEAVSGMKNKQYAWMAYFRVALMDSVYGEYLEGYYY